jgi:hypothetical protein
MEYTTEQLDRSSGDMVETSLGNWITVTELGEQHGVGRKEIRVILHRMGLLQPEGRQGHYRLTQRAVSQGLGKRIERSTRVRWPFDVISPIGQETIASAWATTMADLERERRRDTVAERARTALHHFQASNSRNLTTQEAVSWLADHFPDLSQRQIAAILNLSEPLVSRYLTLRKGQREYGRWVKANLPKTCHETLSADQDSPRRPDEWRAMAEGYNPEEM